MNQGMNRRSVAIQRIDPFPVLKRARHRAIDVNEGRRTPPLERPEVRPDLGEVKWIVSRDEEYAAVTQPYRACPAVGNVALHAGVPRILEHHLFRAERDLNG